MSLVVGNLYAATPAVLERYGIAATEVDPTSDIISSRRDLTGLQIFYPGDRSELSGITDPKIQNVDGLPLYTSDPGTLITTKAMQTLGLQPIPAAWLIQTRGPLTTCPDPDRSEGGRQRRPLRRDPDGAGVADACCATGQLPRASSWPSACWA